MSRLAFFDTNILVHADDEGDPAKQQVARSLMREYAREGLMVISVQVLQEYFATVTRKLKIPANLAQRKIEILMSARVARITERDVISAIEIHRLHSIPFWDALILHTARLAEAKILFSEDFQHGRVIVGVEIRNPFLAVAS